MAKEPVHIIIPVHNRKAITLKCLETLKKNGDLDKYHTIVIDDGSTDGTSEAIKSDYPDVLLLHGDGNLWWTGAVRMGMEYAYEQGAEYLIWLNDDCLVKPNTLNKLINFCKKTNDSIIGSQGTNFNFSKIEFGGKKRKLMGYDLISCDFQEIQNCDLLSGNLVCFHQSVISQVGYPCPKLTPHYGGDSLFLIRSRKAGFKLYVINNHDINNFQETFMTAPQRWLLQESNPLDIIKLVFNPHSLYSWKIWLNLHREDFGYYLGTLTFIIYYNFKFFLPITLIILLRFLPLSLRNKLSKLKQKLTFT